METLEMERIAESELLVTENGAIYHLGLQPEQLAENVITVGDPDRVPMVSKYFDSIELKQQHREFVTHTGRLNNKPISVLSTGIGTDNIDIALTELDALVNIDLQQRCVKPQLKSLNIVRIGTTGALQANIPVDSWLVSSHGVGFDGLMHYYQQKNSAEEQAILNAFKQHVGQHETILRPYIASASSALSQRFGDENYRHGMTATCDGFYGPQGRRLRGDLCIPNLPELLNSFSYDKHCFTNFEMETAGIYGLGQFYGHHCCSISAVVVNRMTHEVSRHARQTMENLIQDVLGKLCG